MVPLLFSMNKPIIKTVALTPEQLEARVQRTNLGIELAHRSIAPGERLSCDEIAAYCDCSGEAIEGIEKRALAKLARLLKKAGVHRTSLRFFVTDESADAKVTPRVESV